MLDKRVIWGPVSGSTCSKDANRGVQAPRGSSLAQKIAFYSVKVGDCVFWKRHWDQPDLPAFMRWEGKVHLVPRLVWEKAKGPIPAKKVVLQTCGHHGCIRLKHLFLGKRGRPEVAGFAVPWAHGISRREKSADGQGRRAAVSPSRAP